MRDPRRRCRPLALGLLLLAAGCSRHDAGKGPAAGGTPPPSGAANAVAASDASPGEGPRITLSPDNVHIEYHVYGHGDPAVLLVHGWACDENYWHAQLDALKARYTVVTLNLAGHGASGANRADWSIANYAQDVAAVARQLPNPQLVLVGHSMGAAVTLTATPLIGERVIGVVAVEALRSVGEPPLTPREIERRVAPFDADFVGATRNLVSSSLFERGADAALVQKVAYNMSLRPPAVAVPSLRSLLSMDLAGLLPAIHVPVYGINSDLLPTDAARIRRSLPDFHLDVLDHTGHFLMLEDPPRFNALLLQDLTAITQRAAH
jgi:pimeloyl-ACP methyl ester carboxylesterase